MSAGPYSSALLVVAALLAALGPHASWLGSLVRLAAPLLTPRARLDWEELARARRIRAARDAAAAEADSAEEAPAAQGLREEPAPEPPPTCIPPVRRPAEPECRPCAPCPACPLAVSVNLTEACKVEAAWDTDRVSWWAALGLSGVGVALGAAAVSWGRRASPALSAPRRPRAPRGDGAGVSPLRPRLPPANVLNL